MNGKEKGLLELAHYQKLAADLAHDMQTAIGGLLCLIQELPSSTQSSELKRIARSVEEFLNEIIETRQLSEEFELIELFQRCFELLKPPPMARLTLPDKPLRLYGPRSQLMRVVLNILSNTLKHCGNAPHTTASWNIEGTKFFIHFADNGPGLPGEVINWINSGRGDSHMQISHRPPAYGIGLSSVAEQAMMWGGKLAAATNKTALSGTVFTFSFSLKKGVWTLVTETSSPSDRSPFSTDNKKRWWRS